jgi:HAMP domain-containing protein
MTQTLSPAETKKLYISLRLKLLAGFTLIFSLVFAGAFYWFLTFATDQALARVKQDLLDTLKGAAAGVNGDELVALAHEGTPNASGQAWLAVADADDASIQALTDKATQDFGTPTQTGFSDDPRYQNELKWLQTVHDLEPRAWPYTYVKGDKPNEVIFITDLWARYDTSKATPFQWHYISKGASFGGLSGLSLKDNLQPYTDSYGNWISAYMPVQNSKGENVGAIGLDFEASYVNDVRQAILDKVVVAFGITYIILFILVYAASGALTGPIIKLTRAAERIAEGDYQQDLSHMSRGNTRDEISTMAASFQVMVDKVYQREQTLIKQVEELKIEIDETKRKSQVSEIVDSEFFVELQAKSRAMRRRRNGEEEPTPPTSAADSSEQPQPPQEPKSAA